MEPENSPAPVTFIQKIRTLFFAEENRISLIYFAASLFSAFMGFVTLPVFTKFMHIHEIGIYGYVMTFNTFLIPLLSLSTESFYLKVIYQKDGNQDERRLLGSLVYFITLWILIFIGILLLAGPLIFHFAGIHVPFFPTMAVMLCSNLFYAFTVFALLRFRVRKKPWQYLFLIVFQNITTTGLAILAILYFSQSANSRITAFTTGTLLTGLVSFVILARHMVFKIDFAIVKKALKFTYPLIPYILSTLIIDSIDRFYLEHYTKGNMTELAFYNMAFQFANIALMISISMFRSYEPVFFRLTSNNDHVSLVKKINQFNLINFTCSILLLFASEFLLNLLTHGKFIKSGYLAEWLIVAFFIKSSILNLDTILTAMGKSKPLMYLSVFAVVLLMIFSPLIVPGYKSEGTVFLKASVYLVLFLITWLWFIRRAEYLKYLIQTLVLLCGLIFTILLKQMLF